MRIRGFDTLTAILDRDPTDGLALADARGHALRYDYPGDAGLLRALRAALEACAVVAATDTLRDSQVREAGMLDHTTPGVGAVAGGSRTPGPPVT